MQIRVGYELTYQCRNQPRDRHLDHSSQPASDIVQPDTAPQPIHSGHGYRDRRHWCSRLVAPAGQFRLSSEGSGLRQTDSGRRGALARTAACAGNYPKRPCSPARSRYCEPDLLSETAWRLFGQAPTGWARVQAICDFVHRHISFGYGLSSPTKTAFQPFRIAWACVATLPISPSRSVAA